MTVQDRKVLRLMVGRWLVDRDEEADLYFQVSPHLQMADMTLQWGDGPRQSRSYALQERDLKLLHEWLTGVLGLEPPPI